jgi:predicted enzyme related to lactoylglutathione lyase
MGTRTEYAIPLASGQIAFFADPQGAAFALWEGELQD